MKEPAINDARSASRALFAKNPVAFDCVHPLDECVARLAALTSAGEPSPPRTQSEHWNMEMKPVPPGLSGGAAREGVHVAKGDARFDGRWEGSPGHLRLSGEVRGVNAPLVPFLYSALVALAGWAWLASDGSRTASALLVVLGIVLVVVMPLVMVYLGSQRAASELELVRTIGQAVGDPEKYASRWRRWRED